MYIIEVKNEGLLTYSYFKTMESAINFIREYEKIQYDFKHLAHKQIENGNRIIIGKYDTYYILEIKDIEEV